MTAGGSDVGWPESSDPLGDPVPAPAGTAVVVVPGRALYDVDPDTVTALVLACPSVTGVSAGPTGTAATYLPGRSVPGVRLGPAFVEVHLTIRYGTAVAVAAAEVRAALAGHVAGRRVDVVVEDVVTDEDLARALDDALAARADVLAPVGPPPGTGTRGPALPPARPGV